MDEKEQPQPTDSSCGSKDCPASAPLPICLDCQQCVCCCRCSPGEG